MKRLFSAMLLVAATLQFSFAQKASELKYYDVKQLIADGQAVMIGQAEQPTADSCYFYRIPNRLKGIVRKELWELGCDGAGIAIRFSVCTISGSNICRLFRNINFVKIFESLLFVTDLFL